MNPKVSIVVPIYRVESYLPACVDSLLGQTLTDIEIILVDDGSPDRCGEIADAYAQREKRVKVIHQQNTGLGPARNAGIRASTGAFVGFVDSDDWVKPQMYEKLSETAIRENADIVVSGHCSVANGKVTKIKSHPLAGKTLASADEIAQMRKGLYGHGVNDKSVEPFPMSVCMSIYRRAWVEAHALRFRNILSEDTIFNLDAYRCAQSISFTGDIDYCYRKEGQTSITQTFSDKKLLKYREFLTVLADMAEKEPDKECVMRASRTAIDYCRLYVGLADRSGVSFQKKKEYVKAFAQTKEIRRCWEGYPLKALPVQQRIFHWMVIKERYGAALILNWLRQQIKKAAIAFAQLRIS